MCPSAAESARRQTRRRKNVENPIRKALQAATAPLRVAEPDAGKAIPYLLVAFRSAKERVVRSESRELLSEAQRLPCSGSQQTPAAGRDRLLTFALLGIANFKLPPKQSW
jgi:hypothetical protein